MSFKNQLEVQVLGYPFMFRGWSEREVYKLKCHKCGKKPTTVEELVYDTDDNGKPIASNYGPGGDFGKCSECRGRDAICCGAHGHSY